MNSITDKIHIGTVGELLVQLRLLEHDVQSAPLKDSGNDLIAIRGESFRAIQVKTTTGDTYKKSNLPELYHILVVVQLTGDEDTLHLDKCPIFLIPHDRVAGAPTAINNLNEFALNSAHINLLFND
jgi:hypothetical protein